MKIRNASALSCVVAATVLLGARCSGAEREAVTAPTEIPLGLPAAFTITRYEDFTEAAGAVGYPVPRSDDYPLEWGHVFVQPGIELGSDLPRKVVAVYSIDEIPVRVTFAPLSFWPEGALSKGEPLELAGNPGWLRTRTEDRIVFSGPFVQESPVGPIWFQVETSPRALDSLPRLLADLDLLAY